jgi:hypothetical protein
MPKCLEISIRMKCVTSQKIKLLMRTLKLTFITAEERTSGSFALRALQKLLRMMFKNKMRKESVMFQ